MEDIKLDALQLKIMKVLWRLGEGSVLAIQGELKSDRHFAITTISTVLQRLFKRHLVDYRKEGRQYIYRALVSESQAKSAMTEDLIQRMFDGNSSILMNHLLESEDFDEASLQKLQEMIDQARNKKNPSSDD